MPVDTIEIKRIAMNAGTQSREAINEEAVSDYFEVLEDEGDLPPVVVYFDGLDYYLADGFHRILAYKRAEREYIDADVKGGTSRDAIKYALQANAEHGLRRTSADKRKAVNMALDDAEWGKLTAREIDDRNGWPPGTATSFVGFREKAPVRATALVAAVRAPERRAAIGHWLIPWTGRTA